MPDPEFDRKWFQLRFSMITLLVVVNLAGLLIWANVHPHFSDGRFIAPNGKDLGPTTDEYYGWPVRALAKQQLEKKRWEREGSVLSFEGSVIIEPIREERPEIVWNVVIGLIVICGVGVITELLVRKLRKAKRHGE